MKTWVLGVALWAGCGGAAEQPHKSLTAVKVRTVERARDASSARYSANIEPATRVDLCFKVGGYVQEVARVRGVDGRPRLMQEGDRVTRGQVLASLRKADYAQKLAEAKAGLGEAVAAREQAELDHDRAGKLAVSKSISAAELDAARVRLDAARARVEGAKVRVDEAQTQLEDASLRAPMEGIILRRSIEVGTLAAPGAPAFSVADTQTVKVVFGVPDTVLETLRLGSTQTIAAEALHGRELRGSITRISPVADPKSRVFEVEVTIPNADLELKAGMIASLNLAGGRAVEPVAVLPLTAVVRAPAGKTGARFAVFVVDEQPAAHIREVELGEFLGNLIPIKSGLAAGERVVVMGATLLSDGEMVQVIP
jgi:multidrug efflux system membrane fusion protein